jgi:hypothetical protein
MRTAQLHQRRGMFPLAPSFLDGARHFAAETVIA